MNLDVIKRFNETVSGPDNELGQKTRGDVEQNWRSKSRDHYTWFTIGYNWFITVTNCRAGTSTSRILLQGKEVRFVNLAGIRKQSKLNKSNK